MARLRFLMLSLAFHLLLTNVPCTDGNKKQTENEAKKVPIEHVEGVLGLRVEMPCDITPRRRDDTVYMVLWFRESAGKPLYSFDVRGKGLKTAKTWSSKTGFDRRADFQAGSYPAHLLVHDLKLQDQGVFRCRVDYRNSPTRNSLVNLTVVVPPSSPIIYDGSGEQVISAGVGPYVEGSDVHLKCRVSGGQPEPTVLWYVNGELEDSTSHVDPFNDVINDLHFRGLNRSHLNSQFSCKASNTRLVQPVERSVTLDLNLKPLFVRMRQRHSEKIVAGKEYRLVCETAGSKPPAVLKWIKGGREITQVSTQDLDNGNVTTSTFLFIPTPQDNGASIICRAENPYLNHSHVLEEIWNINVVYLPEVKLSLGSTLNPQQIKEGTDVYFECRIHANPKTSRLVWLFNGEELKHSAGSGIIMSNQSLVLQGINRKAAGNYTCIATNAEGSTASNAVHLSVMYSAVCLSETGVTVGASKGETVGLRCAVEANPTALRFEWEFHGAGDNVDVVPDGKIQSHGDLSRFFYTPQSDSEFGTFLCWASNDIGRQVQPCVFHVVAAVKPHHLENCSVVNQTGTMIHVECSHHRELPPIPDQPLFRIMNEDSDNPNAHQDPAQYGLFPEYYVMEVWDLKNRSLRRNLSAEAPVFILKGLLPGSWLRLILYAANSHGKSEHVVIEAVVAGDAEKQTLGASTSQVELLPLVLVGIGMACIGTLIVFILALILRSRICAGGMGATRGRTTVTTNNSHCEKSNSLMPSSGITNNSNTMNATTTNNSSGVLAGYRPVPQSKHESDANPDIIPGANHNFSTDYTEDSFQRTLPKDYRKGLFHSVSGGNGGMPQENCQPLLQHNHQAYAPHPNPNLNQQQQQHPLSHTLPRQLPSSHNNHHHHPPNGGPGGSIAAHGPSNNYSSLNPHLHYEYEDEFEPAPVYHHHTLHHHPSSQPHPQTQTFPNDYPSHPLEGHVHGPPVVNDFNTIYIRDKLFRDSDIPESCV